MNQTRPRAARQHEEVHRAGEALALEIADPPCPRDGRAGRVVHGDARPAGVLAVERRAQHVEQGLRARGVARGQRDEIAAAGGARRYAAERLGRLVEPPLHLRPDARRGRVVGRAESRPFGYPADQRHEERRDDAGADETR
jgi:hypothetical protein